MTSAKRPFLGHRNWDPSLDYQWYSNSPANPTFETIPSATNATLSLPNLTAGQSNTMYYLIVSNAYGIAQSPTVTLSVDPPGPPTNVVIVPASQTANAESSATFVVDFAGGVSSLTYGWTLNGVPLSDGALGGSVISGSSTATLTITNAFAVDDGTYVAYVTNIYGNAASSPAILTVHDPAIITNVMGSTNAPGTGPVDLSVTAIGTGLTYQWLSNGVVITGANSSNYVVPNSVGSNTSSYSVIISNSTGQSVTGGPAIVSYTPVLLEDNFNYPTGNLFGDPGSPWNDVNGSNPELVSPGHVQLSELEATTDAQSLFAYTVDGTVVWYSFYIELSTLPPAGWGGTYFCNIEDTNYNFYGRIFCVESNNPALTPGMSATPFPGTYRLGIAFKQNDSVPSSTTGPDAMIPLDLAPGIYYRVVAFVDMNNLYSGMAVNPVALGDLTNDAPVTGLYSGPTDDIVASITPMNAFGLRQRGSEGILNMSNLVVSWDWNGPGSGYAVVNAPTNTAAPVIGLQPVGTTNYLGNPYVMEIAASGVGAPGVGLSYAWYQNGNALSDGNSLSGSATPALTINPLVASNSGTYYCVVTGTGSTQTSNAVISVLTTPTAPSFTATGASEPASTTSAAQGATATLSAVAIGTGPITYVWYQNGSAITSPSSSGTLTLTDLPTGDAGTYYVVATGGASPPAQSSNAVLVVTAPQPVTIAYLRSLLTPGTTPTVSDTVDYFIVTGTNTCSTNLTSGNTASSYIQNATGGINLFITGDSTFRPALGDIITATGTLSVYEDNLEIDVTAGDASSVYKDLGPGTNYPTPIYLPWSELVSPDNIFSGDLNSVQQNVEGSVVTLSNVYFTATGTFGSQADFYDITNSTGTEFQIFVSYEDTNFYGEPVPPYAESVTGPLYQNGDEFAVIVTAYSNIVVGASSPPPVTITNLAGAVSGGGTFTLTWTAVPDTATYSVHYSTNLAQKPFPVTLATNLSFTNSSGIYIDTLRTNPANFYEVSSP